jgi:hypothetical protein
MRVVEEIPHPACKITIFAWNAKYIVKLEAGGFEQSYKINEADVTGLGDIKKMLTPQFIEGVMARFSEMSKEWVAAYRAV